MEPLDAFGEGTRSKIFDQNFRNLQIRPSPNSHDQAIPLSVTEKYVMAGKLGAIAGKREAKAHNKISTSLGQQTPFSSDGIDQHNGNQSNSKQQTTGVTQKEDSCSMHKHAITP